MNERIRTSPLWSLARFLVAGALAGGASSALAIPVGIPYAGLLTTDGGAPVQGTVQVEASLYDVSVGGEPVWSQSHANIAVLHGILSFVLSGGTPDLDSVLEDYPELWLEIAIDEVALAPRQEVLAVPYARFAANAATVGGLAPGDLLAQGEVHVTTSVAVGGQSESGSLTLFDATSQERVHLDASGASFLTGGQVGIGTASPQAAAALEVASTTRGLLPPRMTTEQRDAIPSPPEGLLVYNTTTKTLDFFDGTDWTSAGGTSPGGGGGPRTFTISPAVAGKTFWNLDVDGPFDLSTNGAWVLTATGSFTALTKMWGAGGGSGRNGASCPGGGGGHSTGTVSFTAGVSYRLIVGRGGIFADQTDTDGFGKGGRGTQYGGQGGGGSAIKLHGSPYSPILVAGGGGGCGSENGAAGAGGGTNGQSGTNTSVTGGQGGTPGSSINAESAATAWSGDQGGNGAWGTYVSGGGGGGYAGGGCMDDNVNGGGGGGSGYVDPATVDSGSSTTGNGSTPAAHLDSHRGMAGNGSVLTTSRGNDGRIKLL